MKAATALVVLGLAGTAMGQVWVETGDAPDPLGFQDTVGVGPLVAIIGATGGADFADAYCITIDNDQDWYATTESTFDPNAGADYDTKLLLFALDGTPIMGNDDAPGGSPFHSMVGSAGTWGAFNPGNVDANLGTVVSGGQYILVVTGFGGAALDAAGSQVLNTDRGFSDLWGPDPAAGPFAAMNQSGAQGNYVVGMHNVSYSRIPAPGGLSLLALGGLVATRRRR